MSRAKSGVKNPKGIPNPKLRNQNEVGINKFSGVEAEDKQIVIVSRQDKVKYLKWKRIWLVNGMEYPSKQYKLKVIETYQQPNGMSLKVKAELKQLKTFDYLKKKIQTLNNQLTQYETATLYNDKDNIYLKGKSIKKTRCIISKYLKLLQSDSNFTIKRVGETCFNMGYNGEYVTATHSGNILADRVF